MGTTRRGITFIDLIVALTLAICLLPVAVGVLGRTGEDAGRVKCASNLRQIGQAILLYGNENGNAYPQTRYRPETADAPTAWSGANSTMPFAIDGAAVNDVTAAYRLLLATQDLVPDVFICTSSDIGDIDFARARYKQNHANFLDERELTYSFANPYPTPAARDAGFKLTTSIDAEFAVAADINPGINPPTSDVTAVALKDSARDTRRGNSPNHDRDGQNVLYGDGHVEFQQSPFVGIAHDNLYTFGRQDKPADGFGVFGSPTHAADSVLLPAMNAQFWRDHPPVSQASSNWPWIATIGTLSIALLVAASKVLLGSRSPVPST